MTPDVGTPVFVETVKDLLPLSAYKDCDPDAHPLLVNEQTMVISSPEEALKVRVVEGF